MHVRHEEAGAFAAGAEALLTGRLTACAGTCGPGSLHFINGLYEANRSSSICLSLFLSGSYRPRIRRRRQSVGCNAIQEEQYQRERKNGANADVKDEKGPDGSAQKHSGSGK